MLQNHYGAKSCPILVDGTTGSPLIHTGAKLRARGTDLDDPRILERTGRTVARITPPARVDTQCGAAALRRSDGLVSGSPTDPLG